MTFEDLGMCEVTDEALKMVADDASKSILILSMPKAGRTPDENGSFLDPPEIFSCLNAADAAGGNLNSCTEKIRRQRVRFIGSLVRKDQSMLTPEEKQRYDRQLMMAKIGQDGQEKLKRARVFLAGAGGLGSPIAFFLSAAGIGQLRIVDHGAVERSNLNRQILYQETDLGRNKAECAQKRLSMLNPCIDVQALSESIQNDNAEQLAGSCDVIVDALDNYVPRYILNQVAFKMGVPLVHGAVEDFYGQATTIIPGKTNCLKCLFPEAPPHQAWPIIGMTCGLVASIQAAEVVKCILGIGNLLANRLLILDGLHARMEEIALERNQNCPVCSNWP